jgi:hypothetical protein
VTPRQATIYLLWCGEKGEAGDALTPEELSLMKEARQVSIQMAKSFMRIKDEDFAYTSGQPFQGA